jgi:hypothetical protein
VILIVTALADQLSAAAFKVERSGIEKDQFHFGEQIPSTFKERFLDEVFVGYLQAEENIRRTELRTLDFALIAWEIKGRLNAARAFDANWQSRPSKSRRIHAGSRQSFMWPNPSSRIRGVRQS